MTPVSDGLTHLDEKGNVRMVDVAGKDVTRRRAVARGRVRMASATVRALVDGTLPKGDALATARIAGIMGAKETSRLVPLCHPLPLTHLSVELAPDVAAGAVEITAVAETMARTGVEMEALTAVTVAALTLYDMTKAIDKAMVIEAVRLVSKEGGKSGVVISDPLMSAP